MRLSQFSVRRPIFTVMVTLIVVILGLVSFFRLPIDLMPDITYPTLTVRTWYENASPKEMEELVTRPVEEAIGAVPGVERVTAVSAEGLCNVRSTFAWGKDLDEAANDMRARLDRVIPLLPEDADRPVLYKFDLATYPVVRLGVASQLDPVRLRTLIDDHVKYRIERLAGVAQVNVRGGRAREIHVDLSADKIRALGLSLDRILSRIEAGNVTLPGGLVERGNYEVMVRTPGEYRSLRELEDTVVTVRDGAPIYLRDVAEVKDAWEKTRRIVRINGEPGIRFDVRKQSEANTVEVSERVVAEVERIDRDLPQIKISTIANTADYIQRSITNVGRSALGGGVLAIFVLLLFLRSISSTAVLATAIPISITATFGLMYFSGFTLNVMTLGGLALGIGMLLDSAIVVLENIFRLRETGRDPEVAAVAGSEEVTTAIVASTLTTLVVFVPLIYVGGAAGVMFKQLSLVVSFALLCSLAVAVTLVPMLAAKLLRAHASDAQEDPSWRSRLFRASGRFFKQREDDYAGVLDFALRHRILVVIGAVLLLGGSLSLIPLVGVEFMPAADESEVRVQVEAEVGTRMSLFDEIFQRIEAKTRAAVPETRTMYSRIGGSQWRPKGAHTGRIMLMLVPIAERQRSSEDIANDLRALLTDVPGVTIRTRVGQGPFVLRLFTTRDEKIEVEIRGHDLEVADELARRVKDAVEQVAGITDVVVSRESGSPEELIVIDRQRAADMRLTVSQVASAIQTVLSGTKAGNFREAGKEYAILVKLKEAEHLSGREILDLTITNAAGQPVVLRNVVRIESRTGPVIIERTNQERTVTVAADYTGRDQGSIIRDIRRACDAIPRPADFSINLGGDYEEQVKAFWELLLSFVLAIVLVYMVMACQFESLRDPFVVMFSVPLAAIGVVLMLLLTDTTFNVQSFIGCTMLGGIVVNNAILLVDHTNLLRRRDGLPMLEAIKEAGRRRLRPIVMTATTTMLGLTPLALGLGEGGEAQAPLARAVIGGLMSSTIITLVFVPTMYSIFERRQ